MVKNLPASARDKFKPWLGKIPHAAEQLRPSAQLLRLCSRAHEPQPLSLCVAAIEILVPRAILFKREATAMRSSYTTKRSTHHNCNIANDAANNGLNSKIYKQLIQLSIKNTT